MEIDENNDDMSSDLSSPPSTLPSHSPISPSREDFQETEYIQGEQHSSHGLQSSLRSSPEPSPPKYLHPSPQSSSQPTSQPAPQEPAGGETIQRSPTSPKTTRILEEPFVAHLQQLDVNDPKISDIVNADRVYTTVFDVNSISPDDFAVQIQGSNGCGVEVNAEEQPTINIEDAAATPPPEEDDKTDGSGKTTQRQLYRPLLSIDTDIDRKHLLSRVGNWVMGRTG
jgi:hypothetical protein